jgi:inorganic pyrophosphatase
MTSGKDDAEHRRLLHQAHPWHGVSAGPNVPKEVSAYIEIVPTDAVKYELDKASGHLLVDRPQRFSSMCPSLYGFIPQTYCGDETAQRCADKTGISELEGDKDPMDICVLSEKTFAHGSFFVRARPIGGLRMIDGNQADDKILAVLAEDLAYGYIDDIDDCPEGLIDRLKHYFLSYKQPPRDTPRRVEIVEVYDRAEAWEVIRRSCRDYQTFFRSAED